MTDLDTRTPPDSPRSVELDGTTAATVSGAGAAEPQADLLAPGTRVEVRQRLDARRWHRGFEVVDAGTDGYRLRRLCDGSVLPVALPHDAVRAERRRSQWWY